MKPETAAVIGAVMLPIVLIAGSVYRSSARADFSGIPEQVPLRDRINRTPDLCIFASDVQNGLYRWRACLPN